MKTFLHVLNSWLLSIFIALFFLILWARYEDGVFSLLSDPYLMPVLLFCFAGAIPSFFISWLFLEIILNLSYSNYEKYFLWAFAVVLSIIFDIIVVLFILDGFTLGIKATFYSGIFFYFWPAYLAAIVGILIRLQQFFSLINKTKTHETNMV